MEEDIRNVLNRLELARGRCGPDAMVYVECKRKRD